ncbi:EF-Tu/IF-2/RF-3 family GTPase [Streptomyces sp. MMBL 11-3]|uniref:EF-Tu C-terminal domain-related protein n=1 Tax=Streptomyces sp. MMBL 11-3 TaxID=3382639 RepID=UPI0039B50DF8
MPVEDVFRLRRGREVLVTGRIERGSVHEGGTVETVGPNGGATALVSGIEHNRTPVGMAKADTNVGLLLRDVSADVVERGQVLVTPGSVRAHGVFTADITLLSEEQGGADVACGDRLRFHVRTAGVWGTVTLPRGTGTVRPLHGAEVTVTLEEPVALTEGQPFAFRHHARAAGTGTVTRLPH